MKKVIYKIEGMDCAACAQMIELDLEDAGITAKCSYPKETLEIESEIDSSVEEKILEVIKTSGYKLS
jgi:copper chaperone CopZ